MTAQLQTQAKDHAKSLFTAAPSGLLQRKCACGNHTVAEGECEECSKKKQTLQRAADSALTGAALCGVGRAEANVSVPAIVHDVLRSPGQPLDSPTRAFMESRFGHDFSQARVHTDERAAASARAVNALAYTVGHQLVFQSGHLAPGTTAGHILLTHELAHVIQQEDHKHNHSVLTVAAAHDSFEQDVDRVARTILSGHQAKPAQVISGPALQRQPAPVEPPTSPGPPSMQGPDWGLTCDSHGKCSLNTPAGDVPLEGERYRCYVLAMEGRCPPSCVDTLGEIGVPCVQRPSPTLPRPGGPITPFPPRPCPSDQIPFEGGCLTTHLPPGPRRELLQLGGFLPIRFGTIVSETLDNFALNEPGVPAQHRTALDHLASLLNVYRDVEVNIEGHTDGSGTEAINNPLSRERAEAVKAHLIRRHVVNAARLITEGFSSGRPLVTPRDPTAQEPRNRRVEIWYHIPPSERLGEGLRLRKSP